MPKFILVVLFGLGLLGVLAAWSLQARAQAPAPLAQATSVTWHDVAASGDDRGTSQVIPPADMWEVQYRAKLKRAHIAREQARVQSVIDHIRTHNRFPPRTQPFDAAQQVVIDYIRINQRIPTSAKQVNLPVQAVLDYIQIHHTMPPRTNPLDPAVQEVMDHIRIYNRVPVSACSVY